ncbi:type II toxin-antitoxin system VapC family toxin [Candidatus Woesearchaeota archaeon]|nr:type II toxin-antitoxin system VapC family toxin [Candidatus Woesearchaeota archaeon]
MAVIVDTSFLFALVVEQEFDHKRAEELNKDLDTGRHGRIFYTDFIISEFLTLLRCKRINAQDILREGKKIIDKKDNIIFSSQEMVNSAFEIFSKYQRLSLVDALTVAAARSYNITKIYSFDAGFDGVKGVERVF